MWDTDVSAFYLQLQTGWSQDQGYIHTLDLILAQGCLPLELYFVFKNIAKNRHFQLMQTTYFKLAICVSQHTIS